MTEIPNPGSDEAIKQGCICPVLDNEHGRGYHGQEGVFSYVLGCPLHVVVDSGPDAQIIDTLWDRFGTRDTEPQAHAIRPVIFAFGSENEDGEVVGVVIRDDFTGWIALHHGHGRHNAVFPLTKEQVKALVTGLGAAVSDD